MNETKSKYAACVKLTIKQYNILKEASVHTGRSIPELLRKSYSKRPVRTPIVPHKDALSIMRELKRIGNNVNQIAMRMNRGLYEDWHPEFKIFCNEFSRMYQLLVAYSKK
jgi:hypothetical protein